MTIHTTHPFLEPEGDRDPVRRLRGRLGSAVSLWTAGTGADRAGLTITSWLVAGGHPGRLVALLDPDAELTETLLETRRGVIQLLRWEDRGLADAFAGVVPAPGGPWRLAQWTETDHGPRLDQATTWATISVESDAEAGWSRLVTCTLEEIVIGDDDDVLTHRRGRYAPAAD